MSKIKSAIESAKRRKHKPIFISRKNRRWLYQCKDCGMQFVVNFNPMPNQIDIGGEMVALNCTGKAYYAVNWNRSGYLPESEPLTGLDNVDDIRFAIESCILSIVGDDDYENELRKHDIDMYLHMIKSLIAGDKLEHETLFYIDEFAIFVFKDEENESE